MPSRSVSFQTRSEIVAGWTIGTNAVAQSIAWSALPHTLFSMSTTPTGGGLAIVVRYFSVTVAPGEMLPMVRPDSSRGNRLAAGGTVLSGTATAPEPVSLVVLPA